MQEGHDLTGVSYFKNIFTHENLRNFCRESFIGTTTLSISPMLVHVLISANWIGSQKFSNATSQWDFILFAKIITKIKLGIIFFLKNGCIAAWKFGNHNSVLLQPSFHHFYSVIVNITNKYCVIKKIHGSFKVHVWSFYFFFLFAATILTKLTSEEKPLFSQNLQYLGAKEATKKCLRSTFIGN